MPTLISKGFRYVAALLLSLALGASPALAVDIREVQISGDPPEFLVIYGTGFGTVTPGGPGVGTPVINLGTQVPALTISADQSACNFVLNPPPPPY